MGSLIFSENNHRPVPVIFSDPACYPESSAYLCAKMTNKTLNETNNEEVFGYSGDISYLCRQLELKYINDV